MENKDTLAEGSAELENTAAAATAADEKVAAENQSSDGDNGGTHQEHIQQALELLYVHFPKAFFKEGDCKPLKIGILEDLKPLIADIDGLSISKVRAAVRVYTTRLRYFYSVREGAMRVDLNGNEVEPVTAEHAEYARTRFTEINSKRRPARPKKPQARPQGRAPRRPDGQDGQRRFNNRDGGNGGQRRFNNRNGAPQRTYEPAKEADIRPGRYVYVSTERSYVKGTVSEPLKGDKVSITLMNGIPASVPLSSVYLSSGGAPRPKRNGPGGHFNNNRGPRSNGNGRFNNSNNNRRTGGQGQGGHQGGRPEGSQQG